MQPATNKAVLLIAFAINSSPRFGAVVVVCSYMHVVTNTYTTLTRLEMPSDPHVYEARTDLIILFILLKRTTSYCIQPTVPLQMHAISKPVTIPAGSLDSSLT
ncbi:hypothetical protein CPAR01_06192 [Colletotrichum paranaense]|uniref:Secreted protein n=1 Tax=Colletotrichum paranaense TaxID=1914294 RepID=A0ABQ9STE5_9PEZI|nr:uncharacterized protein CPAR01_06192 [Colletotrichum paranaense]KAK1542805.1 hypothetical protein CPAR01_06192 [Colletotrichum paranaense]